ncbi:MAG: DNA-binding protein HU [Syntrophus sp. SKADARSKE-3]|nr:DNA-binding protein HU [Syntrophus sp. SKADARSKE-3]
MNKADLINALAKKEILTEKDATNIVNLIFKGFTETLKHNGRIEIRGLASFSVRQYDSYNGRNPKSGELVSVKPKRLPFFKVGKELKDKLNRTAGKS